MSEEPEPTQLTVSAEDAAMLKDAGVERVVNAAPTRAEMKAAIKDESLPEIVRRNIREQLYGEGGGGRKAEQQRLLRRQMSQLQPGQRRTEGLKKPQGMSGRQFKKARKLINKGRKFVFRNSSV